MERNHQITVYPSSRSLFAAALLAFFPLSILAQPPAATTKKNTGQSAQPHSGSAAKPAQNPATVSGQPPTGATELGLPPAPQSVSTVIGGEIREVDPVLDTLTLKVPGGNTRKIFFDARTKFFRNGVPAPLQDLKAGQHASIETALAGTDVFAVSIHMLTKAPTGECQGQVLSYDSGNGNLSIRSTLSTMPIKLRVPPGTPITRGGQAASAPGHAGLSDLAPGALVEATFISGHGSRGIAKSITVLAQPGTAFKFSGTISYLNLATGKLTLLDPRNHKSYPIFFDAGALPMVRSLHEGEHVTVTAGFDGRTYTARKITAH